MSNESNNELVNEQYSQYYQMLRHHLTLSWQIPSLVVAAVILFFGFDSSKIQLWASYPLYAAGVFLVIGLFLLVMFVHHKRNLFYANHYSKILAEMEQKFGYKVKVHHFQVEPEKDFIHRISSSLLLSIYLAMMVCGTFVLSLYYFVVSIKL